MDEERQSPVGLGYHEKLHEPLTPQVLASLKATRARLMWEHRERQADQDIKAGRLTHYDNDEDFLASFD